MLYAGDADNTLMSAFRNNLNQSEERRRQVAYSLEIIYIYIYIYIYFTDSFFLEEWDVVLQMAIR
jgi:hypothetical protein